ncbi:MAG: threonine/serine exporter family protein [Propionibacteriales bacterium]|nr:threonine/serine exporter family protein [Propionibacteriales bacterium]
MSSSEDRRVPPDPRDEPPAMSPESAREYEQFLRATTEDRTRRGWRDRALSAFRERPRSSGQTQEYVAIDPARDQRVLDLALRMAEMLLTVGASVHDVTLTTLRIVRAFGLTTVHVDVTYAAITVTLHRGQDREPLTMVRVVNAKTTDYTRLQRLQALVGRIEGGLDVRAAREQYLDIIRAGHPYRRWIVLGSNGVLAAGVCLLLGATPLIMALAFVAAVAASWLQVGLDRARLPTFFKQMGGAFTVTAVAILATGLDKYHIIDLSGLKPSLVVAAGIVMLLAGMSVVGAAQDALDGSYITAGARTFEVAILTLGIVVGIMMGLYAGQAVGIAINVETTVTSIGTGTEQVLGSVLVAAAFGVGSYAGPRTVLACAALGGFGMACYLLVNFVGLGPVTSAGLAATVSGVVAQVAARRLVLPALALSTAAIVPLMPGSVVFRGLLELVGPTYEKEGILPGVETIMSAGAIGLALAAGVSLGTWVARPLTGKAFARRRQSRV